MILTGSQFTAVYGAMFSLNDVGGRVASVMLPSGPQVMQAESGRVYVQYGNVSESYADQTAFRHAYEDIERITSLGFKDRADYDAHQATLTRARELASTQMAATVAAGGLL